MYKIQTKFIDIINIKELSSDEEFTIVVLETIYNILYTEKDKLFPCNCTCIDNNIIEVYLYPEKISDSNHFYYSLETGFYPSNMIKNYYSEIIDFESIYIGIQVNLTCFIE
jgi:hypothetical protein